MRKYLPRIGKIDVTAHKYHKVSEPFCQPCASEILLGQPHVHVVRTVLKGALKVHLLFANGLKPSPRYEYGVIVKVTGRAEASEPRQALL
jgi:hypothetical protein